MVGHACLLDLFPIAGDCDELVLAVENLTRFVIYLLVDEQDSCVEVIRGYEITVWRFSNIVGMQEIGIDLSPNLQRDICQGR